MLISNPFPYSASKNYYLAMHVFGCMTQTTTLKELEDVVCSSAVVFSSSHSGKNVEKHFKNLQLLLKKQANCETDDASVVEEDFVV